MSKRTETIVEHPQPANWRRHSRLLTTFILASFAAAVAASATRALGEDVATIVAGITSRSQAITSGRFSYTFKSESFRGDQPLPVVLFPELTTSFSGSSWAERSPNTHVVRINHDGYYLEFVQTPQKNGSVRPGVTLFPQRALESRKEFNAPPLFAGSFWYQQQLRYVDAHAAAFREVRKDVIHGVNVVVLEASVSAAKRGEAFHVLLPALKSGGILRLHVAPQLGFVLPRIEFLTPANQLVHSYEAVEFSEMAPGVYLPRRIWTETLPAAGSSRYRAEFAVRYDLINQPIPAEDFVAQLPPGTHVQDAHEPGDVIKFDTPAASTTTELISQGFSSDMTKGVFGRWQNAAYFGIMIGTVVSIGLLLAVRSKRQRA